MAKLRCPPTSSYTTITGMDRDMMPAMGPTAECSWQGEKRTSPEAASFSASSGVEAHPSYMQADMMAPAWGRSSAPTLWAGRHPGLPGQERAGAGVGRPEALFIIW